MAQYAIAFDLDSKTMRQDGMSQSQIVLVYQKEIPEALKACGFEVHPQGSLYHTSEEQNAITSIMTLQSTLQAKAPSFCKYVRRVHVFRMEDWSDVTSLIRHPSAGEAPSGAPTAEEEAAENEVAAAS